jgi:hypothetical protein
MRLPLLLLTAFLAGCSSVEEQAQAAKQKAATIGTHIETKVSETSTDVSRKTRTFWQWLTGENSEDSAPRKSTKAQSSTSQSGSSGTLDTVPQPYVGKGGN